MLNIRFHCKESDGINKRSIKTDRDEFMKQFVSLACHDGCRGVHLKNSFLQLILCNPVLLCEEWALLRNSFALEIPLKTLFRMESTLYNLQIPQVKLRSFFFT